MRQKRSKCIEDYLAVARRTWLPWLPTEQRGDGQAYRALAKN